MSSRVWLVSSFFALSFASQAANIQAVYILVGAVNSLTGGLRASIRLGKRKCSFVVKIQYNANAALFVMKYHVSIKEL